jgi:hypothetical protein
MDSSQEMFRFAMTRRAEHAAISAVQSRLITDRRDAAAGSLLARLFGPGEFDDKLVRAASFARSADFLAADAPALAALGPFGSYLRAELTPGMPLADLAQAIQQQFPVLAELLEKLPRGPAQEAIDAAMFSIWDSFYAQTILGSDRYVSTNYLIDGLRSYHVLRLLLDARGAKLTDWTGHAFDDYDALIDLAKAAAAAAKANTAASSPGAASRSAFAAAATFRVPLTTGAVKPPVVGDLLLVEQELRGYELGEMAAIESIMPGERRERTIRSLARSTSTTTTETSSEQDQSSSVTTDERFQLSSQAQQTAAQSVGVQAGVSVTGKFGPVQVGTSVNASYNSSQSTSTSTSQEYAKTVTEQASQSVKNSIKQSSSVTILTESEDTSLRGWNNEAGTTSVNGLYRWLDKLYDARLMNYGRRLMLSANVPEPSSFYRGLLQQAEDAITAGLEQPVPPARLDPETGKVLPEGGGGGFVSYLDLTEDNYAWLAARYDVPVEPPPAEFLTGSKAIVEPDAMPPTYMEDHKYDDDLSLVTADSTLTIPAGYRATEVAVLAPQGAGGALGNYVDTLKLGGNKTDTVRRNIILVQVAGKSFYLTAFQDPKDSDAKVVDSNFNTYRELAKNVDDVSAPFAGAVQSTLPVTVTANFEGMLAVTVAYKALRTDEAMADWQSSTYAAIVKGSTAQQQAYEQARTIAAAQAQTGTEAETFTLREDQYRAIELTELKRGCIDLLSEGTAAGFTSIRLDKTHTPTTVFEPPAGPLLADWRAPLANGSVAEFFELAFDWDSITYQFFPYYWAGRKRWADLARAAGADPVFEQFLRAGNSTVVVPVRPGYERPVLYFLKTGLVWGGGYLALFTDPDMLDVYADVELGREFDPPVQVGDTWPIRLPTTMVMLQSDDTLPTFPPEAT